MNDEKVVARVCPAAAEVAAADAALASDVEGLVPEPAPPRGRPWLSPAAIGGGALALLLVIMGVWFAARPLARGHEPLWLRRERAGSAAGAIPSTLDSIRPDSAAANTALLTPANPADSATADAYAVVVARFNTRSGAQLWLQSQTRDLPSPTFAPFRVNGEIWYRAVAGSFLTRAGADSLLQELSAKGLSRPESANVIRAPFAFLVDSVTAEAVPGMLKYFAARGQPVYALRQADGSARLYSGAFESPNEAALDLQAIRTGGNIKPVLVYRIGRVF